MSAACPRGAPHPGQNPKTRTSSSLRSPLLWIVDAARLHAGPIRWKLQKDGAALEPARQRTKHGMGSGGHDTGEQGLRELPGHRGSDGGMRALIRKQMRMNEDFLVQGGICGKQLAGEPVDPGLELEFRGTKILLIDALGALLAGRERQAHDPELRAPFAGVG